jgi:hypothetical protein
MSQIYKIIRWDAVLKMNNINPRPVISIKPDKNFKIFAEANKNTLLIKIHNTNGLYQCQNGIVGIVDTFNSFSPDTVSILLISDWYGYPDCTGDCEIFGLNGGIPIQTINNITLRTIPIKSSSTPVVDQATPVTGMSKETIIGISFGIIVIFLVTLFLTKK